MKTWSSMLIAAILVLACAPSVTAQTQITIQNPSFEAFNALNIPWSGGPYNSGPIPSWTISGTGQAGSWQPSSTVYTSLANGSTAAYTTGQTISQDLGVSVIAGATYTLTVSVGHRLSCCVITANISLLAGTTTLASSSASNSAIPDGAFAVRTVTYTAPNPAPSGNLAISLGTPGSQSADFDNVALTVTPQHSVTISWNPSSTPNVTYRVYRSNGAVWAPVVLADNMTATNFVDTTIVIGPGNNYVYKITAFLNGVEFEYFSPPVVVTQ
jgi:hypothetical protein